MYGLSNGENIFDLRSRSNPENFEVKYAPQIRFDWPTRTLSLRPWRVFQIVIIIIIIMYLKIIIIIIIIIWFGDTVTVTHPTNCNTNSKVRAMSV